MILLNVLNLYLQGRWKKAKTKHKKLKENYKLPSKDKNTKELHNVPLKIEFLESPQPSRPTARPLPKGNYSTSPSCCRDQEALFPVVCWTVMTWVFPRNDQMCGIRGKAGAAPGEGWWERRAGRTEEGREGGKWSWGTAGPFAFGSGSTGRYPSTKRSSYMFNADLVM